MRIQNLVKKVHENGNDILFLLEEETDRPAGTPAMKMITDSEELAFVYLLDEDEGYTYIHFPKDTWPYMAKALESGNDPLPYVERRKTSIAGLCRGADDACLQYRRERQLRRGIHDCGGAGIRSLPPKQQSIVWRATHEGVEAIS